MTHNELLDSLAGAKNSIFKDIYLGSKYIQRSLPRADLVVVKPSYNRFLIDIYEVKENRADFLSDIRTNKWKKYLPYCHRFFFAVKKGIVDKKEIPEPAGLITYNGNTWTTIKTAEKREIDIDPFMLFSMIFYKQKNNTLDKRYYTRNIYNVYDKVNKEVKEAILNHYWYKELKGNTSKAIKFYEWIRKNESAFVRNLYEQFEKEVINECQTNRKGN